MALLAVVLACSGNEAPEPAKAALVPSGSGWAPARVSRDHESRDVWTNRATSSWRATHVASGVRQVAVTVALADDSRVPAAAELWGRKVNGVPQQLARTVVPPDEWRELLADIEPGEWQLEMRAQQGRALAWSRLRVTATGTGPSQRDPRPDIVLIVTDTLRADHLGAYGYERPTSPGLDRWMARALVHERAYSASSWTIPSMASLLTGVHPHELAGGDGDLVGIPGDVPALAALMRDAGYTTAGFCANMTVAELNGFGRGFETFFSPPFAPASMRFSAADLNRRVRRWLGANRAGPRFLYVHYLDPHDPYAPPDTPENTTPFDPGYSGPIDSASAHALHLGSSPTPSPRDLAHLAALYDNEIRYLDGEAAALLGDPLLRGDGNTLTVFTADHGEELGEHGGFKHGLTLFEDQVHVPLAMAWPEKIASGRSATPVGGVDVARTLLAAAGIAAPPGWRGRDLLAGPDAGHGPVFAETFAYGPPRAMHLLAGRKSILFLEGLPFRAEATPEAARMRTAIIERLPSLASYDPVSDPQERAPGPGDTATVEALEAYLAPFLGGVQLRCTPGAGSTALRYRGRVKIAGPLGGAGLVHAGPGDRLTTAGSAVEFEFTASAHPVGVAIASARNARLTLDVARDGTPLPPASLRLGHEESRASGMPAEIAAARVPRSAPPRYGEPGACYLWLGPEPQRTRERANAEMVARFKALGYLR